MPAKKDKHSIWCDKLFEREGEYWVCQFHSGIIEELRTGVINADAIKCKEKAAVSKANPDDLNGRRNHLMRRHTSGQKSAEVNLLFDRLDEAKSAYDSQLAAEKSDARRREAEEKKTAAVVALKTGPQKTGRGLRREALSSTGKSSPSSLTPMKKKL
jgi:hypothetical protein